MIIDLFPIDIAEEIVKRLPTMSITNMDWLIEVWKEYVEPGLDTSCGICKERIYNNYRNLHGALIIKIQESRLLDQT